MCEERRLRGEDYFSENYILRERGEESRGNNLHVRTSFRGLPLTRGVLFSTRWLPPFSRRRSKVQSRSGILTFRRNQCHFPWHNPTPYGLRRVISGIRFENDCMRNGATALRRQKAVLQPGGNCGEIRY